MQRISPPRRTPTRAVRPLTQRNGSARTHQAAAAEPEFPTIKTPGYRMGRNLVLAIVVIAVTIRFFTDVTGVLPAFFNFIDVGLLLVLAAYAALGVTGRRPSGARPGFVGAITAFVVLWGVSTVANLDRTFLPPVLLFLYGFAGPIAFYLLTYRVWPVGQARAISSTFVALGAIQFLVVGLVDLPRFGGENPDRISGTFGENPYQMVIFLIIFGALIAGIATFERKRLAARLAPGFILATFLVIFLAQYRSLLITTALAVILVAVMISTSRGRGAAISLIAIAALAGSFLFVSAAFPILRFDRVTAALQEHPGTLLAGKADAAHNVWLLYQDNPKFALLGAGPGTYSSRAWRTFALIGVGRLTDVSGSYVQGLLGSEGYRTDVSDRYIMPRLQEDVAILGSQVLAAPWMSYLALLAEVGVVGLVLMLGIYGTALSRALRRAVRVMRSALPNDPLPAVMLAAAVSLFVILQAAFFDNWLENSRVTVPAWILLAVATKEYHARRLAAAGDGSRRPVSRRPSRIG